MAIAFDAASDGTNNVSATSITWAHACTGSDRCLIVAANLATGGDLVSGVTYNSVSLTQIANIGDGSRRIYLFYLLAPATGSNNVVISCSTAFVLGGSSSYTGVGSLDNSATNQTGGAATTLTTSLTTVADNCWTVLAETSYSVVGTDPTAGTGSTRRAHDPTYGAYGLFDSNAAITPAGSTSMQTNRATASNPISHVMASFAPPGGGASAVGPLTGGGSLQHGTLIRGGRLVTMPVRAPALWMPDRRIAA